MGSTENVLWGLMGLRPSTKSLLSLSLTAFNGVLDVSSIYLYKRFPFHAPLTCVCVYACRQAAIYSKVALLLGFVLFFGLARFLAAHLTF